MWLRFIWQRSSGVGQRSLVTSSRIPFIELYLCISLHFFDQKMLRIFLFPKVKKKRYFFWANLIKFFSFCLTFSFPNYDLHFLIMFVVYLYCIFDSSKIEICKNNNQMILSSTISMYFVSMLLFLIINII